jgi:hypothetical protein
VEHTRLRFLITTTLGVQSSRSLRVSKIKFKFEYPSFIFSNKDPEAFGDLTLFDIGFDTTLHYMKNHSTGYEHFVFRVLGFGLRLTRGS